MKPSSLMDDGDWSEQAADAVVKVVGAVRDKTTGPVFTVLRAVVYGLIGVAAVLVALIVLTIALVRLLDVYLPGEVWSAYLLLGIVFSALGWFLWAKRDVPEHLRDTRPTA